MIVERLPSKAFASDPALEYEDVFELHPLFEQIAFKSNLILVGPKGIAKTLSIASWAGQEGCPLVTFDCSEDIRRAHLLGMFTLRGDESPFVLGPITTAIEVANEVGKCVLCLEEINALTPSVQKMLNAIGDYRRRIEVPECQRVFELNSHAKLWLCGTMNTCFHPDTEIMTPKGVVPLADLKVGDEVYSLNPETGGVELDTVANKWAEWAERLVSVENQHCRLRLTPEHKMVVESRHERDKGEPWGFRTVQEMGERTLDQRPTDSYWEYPKPFDLPDGREVETIRVDLRDEWLPQTNTKNTCRREYKAEDFLELLGWYISEGSVYSQKTGSHLIYIAQDDKVKRAAIRNLLERMGIPHSTQKRSDGRVKGVSFNDKILFHALQHFGGTLSEGKFIHVGLFSLSKRLLRHLFDTMYAGDGDTLKERHNPHMERTLRRGTKLFRSRRYTTKSLQLRRDMLWLATYLGYTTTSGFDSGVHRIGMRPAKPRTVHLEYEEISYEGWVINVEVSKNRTICAGEDGRFLFVSNSVYGGVYELNEDLKSRFRMLPVDYPQKGDETRILSRVCPGNGVKKETIKEILTLAHETRQKSLAYALSTRDVVQIVEDTRACGIDGALRLASGKFEGEDRKFFLTRVQSIFGVTVK